MSLTKVTPSMISGAAVSVLDYGATTASLNNTAAFALALAAVPANGILEIPAGTWYGYFLVWRSDITIRGAGSASTTLKLPASCPAITVQWGGGGTITGLPSVIEIGECALGNIANAYTRINVIGLTIDGNYSNNTAPITDLFGHGMILTKASYCFIDDVVAQNCYTTGIDNVINSNYNTINATTIDCGHALISGGYYPNFDINSSKYGTFNITSKDGKYGGRMLDNCWNNTFTLRASNPSYTGCVYGNQSVNVSYNNIIDATVYDGCGLGQGVSIGANCSSSIINATVYSAAGEGVIIQGASGTEPTANKITITTQECGASGVNVGQYATHNDITVISNKDGRSGAAGDYHAIQISGQNNLISCTVKEGASSQVRGVGINPTAVDNKITALMLSTNLVSYVSDSGTRTSIIHYPGVAASVASANGITLPLDGSLIPITGTTGIVTIIAASQAGRTVTLKFASSVVINVGGNILLAGSANFSATANDTLTLICDGTNWIEVARTVI